MRARVWLGIPQVEKEPSCEPHHQWSLPVVPAILTLSLPRSAIGVTHGGTLLLVTSASATIVELARVMRALGAHDAMNLDGGASSGLWVDGRYLTTPGRDVSHALVIVRR